MKWEKMNNNRRIAAHSGSYVLDPALRIKCCGFYMRGGIDEAGAEE